LQFDTQQGLEKLWLIFSPDAIPAFDALKKYANAQTRGQITEPAENKLVQNFLSAHSTAKPEVERGDALTTVKTTADVLVYPLKLEHH